MTDKNETTKTEACTALGQSDSTALVMRIAGYLDQLAPHAKEREAAKLLIDAKRMIETLHTLFCDGFNPGDDIDVNAWEKRAVAVVGTPEDVEQRNNRDDYLKRLVAGVRWQIDNDPEELKLREEFGQNSTGAKWLDAELLCNLIDQEIICDA